ncbi:MAG: SlyX family protein [Rhodanobacter sp.]|jgi:SlyX protein|nr:SlyX family protein [Rhodanobacter sp.]
MSALEDRLTELEVRLAFTEDAVTSLSETVAAHDRLLHDLRATLERVRNDLVMVRGSLAHDARDEPPPPHY